jgi:hypothetical protein
MDALLTKLSTDPGLRARSDALMGALRGRCAPEMAVLEPHFSGDGRALEALANLEAIAAAPAPVREALGTVTDMLAVALQQAERGDVTPIGATARGLVTYLRGDFGRALPFLERQALSALVSPLLRALAARAEYLTRAAQTGHGT